MLEEIASEVLRLASGTLSLPMLLGVILLLAVILVVLKRSVGVKLPPMPPVSPDLVESPPSPPITVQPDGSIPVSNEQGPPDPTKG
jgi:hypothetical protein